MANELKQQSHDSKTEIAPHDLPIDEAMKAAAEIQPAGEGQGLGDGSVETINGPLAEECYDFRATNGELKTLGRHWYEDLLDTRIFTFLTGQDEWREENYALCLLRRIQDVIGKEAVNEIIAKLDKEARARLGEERWGVFIHGTPEQRRAVQDEVHAKLNAAV